MKPTKNQHPTIKLQEQCFSDIKTQNTSNKAPKKTVKRSSHSKQQQNIEQKIKHFTPKQTFSYSAFGGNGDYNQHQKYSDDSSNITRSLLSYSSANFSETFYENSLWRGVITQAIIDAVSGSKKSYKIKAKNSALEWFDINNNDFLAVCAFANYCPEYVLKNALNAINCCHTWKRDLKYQFHPKSTEQKKYYKTAKERDLEQYMSNESAWY